MEAQMDAATGSPLLASRVDNIHALVAGELFPASNFSFSFSFSAVLICNAGAPSSPPCLELAYK
jgi:hypothetical protein